VFQEWAREGGARHRAREEAVRQARGHRQARGGPRGAGGDPRGEPVSGGPTLRWTRGGEARGVSLAEAAIVLRSAGPWPPGARGAGVEGRLAGEPPATLRVKVHASKKQPEGDYVLEGRTLDVTREVRERIVREVGAAAEPRSRSPGTPHA